tara:strand:+ start:474 stop:719 length:246 start_codon:yes stop_codon:yes gene_type:complete
LLVVVAVVHTILDPQLVVEVVVEHSLPPSVVQVMVEMSRILDNRQEKTLVPAVAVEVMSLAVALVVMVVLVSFSSHIPPNK